MRNTKLFGLLVALIVLCAAAGCQGKFRTPDGGVYEGTHFAQIPTGHGKLTLPDGRVYEGSFQDGLAHGFGKVTMAGFSYEGQWYEGIPLWHGTVTYNGTSFPVNLTGTTATSTTLLPSAGLTSADHQRIDNYMEVNRPTIQWSR